MGVGRVKRRRLNDCIVNTLANEIDEIGRQLAKVSVDIDY